MRQYRYILLMAVASLMWGCVRADLTYEGTDSDSYADVEVLDDGRLRVAISLECSNMTQLETRSTAYEDNIYNGWCMVFGKTDGGENLIKETGKSYGYGDDSPLIEIVPVDATIDNKFYATFNEFDDVSYIRIVVNLTDRENEAIAKITTWQSMAESVGGDPNTAPSHADVEKYRDDPTYNLATFGQYRHQSVGLDGIYNLTYNTATELVHSDVAIQDYSGADVYWTVQYSNSDANHTSGYSYLTGEEETYNGNVPDAASVNTTTGFPMASYGFTLDNLSEDSLKEAFGNSIDMIRVCSKVVVDVSAANDFTLQEVYLINGAQEARIRSTVMSSIDSDIDSFSLPVNLGGVITYGALSVSGDISDPIYFYPNSGGDYSTETGVNQDINPQYIVIKGIADGYDTPGYYKVALKAQYPLVVNPSDDKSSSDWSSLTYDILRNTSFTVNVTNIEKAGYKTLDEALDENSPANNVSYSITIEVDDNRYEILVSKGTYYTVLETSRVYVKGYTTDGIEDCYIDFSMIPSEGNVVPSVYVQSSDYDGDYTSTDVDVQYCLVLREGEEGYESEDWTKATRVDLSAKGIDDGVDGDYWVKITGTDCVQDSEDTANGVLTDKSDKPTKVRVYYNVTDSGRIRLRMGDILKFIPVTYDPAPISMYGTAGQDGTGTSIVVEDAYGNSWTDFSHTDIEYDEGFTRDEVNIYDEGFILLSDGTVEHQTVGEYTIKPEMRARIFPQNAGDGIAVLYLRQASDFKLMNDAGTTLEENNDGETIYKIAFTAKSRVYIHAPLTYNLGDLFELSDFDPDSDIDKDEVPDAYSVVLDLNRISAESVDDITIQPLTITNTTVDENDNPVTQADYFNQVLSDDGKVLTLTASEIEYDIYSSEDSGSLAGREAYTKGVLENFILYNNTATVEVVIQNIAGDTKTYTVELTQYPPVYLVSPTGESGKTFNIDKYNGSISSSNIITSYACVFALNLWNYDVDNSDYSIECEIEESSSSHYIGKILVPYVFSPTYLYDGGYNWGSDKYNTTVSGTAYYGGTPYSSMTVCEVNLIGGYNDPAENNVIVGLIRNTNYRFDLATTSPITATAKFTITDQFGDTYYTEKSLIGN